MKQDRDIVFVDTSVFVAENFFCDKSRVSQLAKLVHTGVLSLITTEISKNEIIRNLYEESLRNVQHIKKNFKRLRNFTIFEPYFNKGYAEIVAAEVSSMVEKFFQNAHALTLGYDYCSNVGSIFEKYFNEERPFHEGDKKYEFPDAFVLQSLEEYCRKNGLKIIVLSTDKDMSQYLSDRLVHRDYKEYLTEKLVESEIKENIFIAINNNKQRICEEIASKLSDELYDDDSRFWNYFNAEEIRVEEIVACDVEMDSDFSITSKDSHLYEIEVNMNSSCEVKLRYFSLDMAYYDHEDHQYYGGEWETSNLEGSEDFVLHLVYDAEYDDLEMADFDILDAVPSFH